MITIRKGVFETNSSSSHSIVLMKQDKPVGTDIENNKIDAGWRINKDGKMGFYYETLDFGRSPFDLLTDWFGRLRYCIAYYANNQNKLEELKNICQRRIKGFVDFDFGKDLWDTKEYHGYVDHQSMGLLDGVLEKYNVNLEEFIFNDRFIIVVDGDEYNVFDSFIKAGLLNHNGVKDIINASYGFEEAYYTKIKNGEKE